MQRFSAAGKRICIAGAGIGGLAFGLSLQRFCQEQGISLPEIHVFERDDSAEGRAGKGYSLGVRGDSGGLQASCTHRRISVVLQIAPVQAWINLV